MGFAVGIRSIKEAVAATQWDFVVTGLPGTGSTFLSVALSEGTKAFCWHEYDGGHLTADKIGDASSKYLLPQYRSQVKRLLVVRDTDECLESFLRRYPSTDRKAAVELFDKLLEGQEALKDDERTLTLEYEPQWGLEVLVLAYRHCVGNIPNRSRLANLLKIKMLKHE